MSNSFLTGIGFILFVKACIDVCSVFKKKNLFVKIAIMLALLVSGAVVGFLVGAFFFNIFEPEGVATTSIAGAGWVSITITTILKYFHFERKRKTQLKEYKSARNTLIVMSCSVLFLVGMLGYLYYGNLQKINSCKMPETIVNGDCCIPDSSLGFILCSEQALKAQKQLSYSQENQIYTETNEELISNSFSVRIPAGYIAARNISMGYASLPILLLKIGPEGENIGLRIIYSASPNYEDSLKSVYSGAVQLASAMQASGAQIGLSQPSYKKLNPSLQLLIYNMSISNGINTVFSSQAVFLSGDKMLMIVYSVDRKDGFRKNMIVFMDMVQSVKLA